MGLEDPVPILSLEIMCPCVVLTTGNLTPPPPVSPQFPVGPVKDKAVLGQKRRAHMTSPLTVSRGTYLTKLAWKSGETSPTCREQVSHSS